MQRTQQLACHPVRARRDLVLPARCGGHRPLRYPTSGVGRRREARPRSGNFQRLLDAARRCQGWASASPYGAGALALKGRLDRPCAGRGRTRVGAGCSPIAPPPGTPDLRPQLVCA